MFNGSNVKLIFYCNHVEIEVDFDETKEQSLLNLHSLEQCCHSGLSLT